MYSFIVLNDKEIPWNKIESTYDSTVFHTKQWNDYIKKIGRTPYVVSILKGNDVIGYFIGQRLGFIVHIIIAPLGGLGTYTQGIVMLQEISKGERIEIYKELKDWVFNTNQAVLFQVDDWQLRTTSKEWIPYEVYKNDDLENAGIKYSVRPTLCVPINTSEEEMWSNLHYKSCKYCINKARKLGLYVREITRKEDIEEFTKIHYNQLVEVCAKQGMKPKPSQKQKRMQMLCESLFPNRVIMLEVLGKDDNGVEQIMSTGIYCLDKGQSVYWTGASYQRYQKFCPNELMVWEAMKLGLERGAGILNFGGMASYKLKFGTLYEYVPRFSFSKYSFMKNIMKNLLHSYHYIRNTIAKIVGKKSFK